MPVVNRMNEAGIPAINFDVKAAGGRFITFVGHDWLMSGIMSGLQIVDASGGEGNVVLIEGSPGTDAQFNRTKGIELVLSAYPKLKIVAKQRWLLQPRSRPQGDGDIAAGQQGHRRHLFPE